MLRTLSKRAENSACKGMCCAHAKRSVSSLSGCAWLLRALLGHTLSGAGHASVAVVLGTWRLADDKRGAVPSCGHALSYTRMHAAPLAFVLHLQLPHTPASHGVQDRPHAFRWAAFEACAEGQHATAVSRAHQVALAELHNSHRCLAHGVPADHEI